MNFVVRHVDALADYFSHMLSTTMPLRSVLIAVSMQLRRRISESLLQNLKTRVWMRYSTIRCSILSTKTDPRAQPIYAQMSAETGEDLGEEFGEVVDRLEKGQSPEEIEKAMPDLADEGAGWFWWDGRFLGDVLSAVCLQSSA